MTGGRRRTLVTDAGRFVGPELVGRLAGLGHDLLVHAPSNDLKERLKGSSGVIDIVTEIEVPPTGPGSLATAEGWEFLTQRALVQIGGLDSAVVTSLNYAEGPLQTTSTADYERVRQNIDIAFHALRSLTAFMDRDRQAAILVLSSAHATNPQPGWAAYSATRSAQRAMVRAAALEVAAEGLSINTIATAFLDFPEYRGGNVSAGDKQSIARIVPTRTFGDLPSLATFCVPFLDSPDPHVTGQFISYSGGWSW